MRIDQKVLGHYGATDIPTGAIWLLNDGTFVNSAKTRDHEDIAIFYPGKTGPQAVGLFMRHGAVRVEYANNKLTFEFTRPLSPPQKKRMSKIAWDCVLNDWDFTAIRYGNRNYRVEETAISFLGYLANYCHFVPLPGDGGIDITKEGMRYAEQSAEN